MDNLEEFLQKIWDKVNNDIFSFFHRLVSVCIDGINESSYKIFSYSFTEIILSFFQILGFAFYIIGSLVALCNIALEYTEMHSIRIKRHILPFFIGLFTVFGFTTIPIELYKFACDMQKSFLGDILKNISNGELYPNIFSMPIEDSINKIFNMASSFSIIYIIVIVYCIIRVFLSTIKRGGVLLTMIGIGSFNMFSIPNNGYDALFKWIKQIFALCITAFFQTTLLSIGFALFSYENILGLGMMIASSETGKIAQVFGLDVSAKESYMHAKQTFKDILRTGKLLSIL